MRVSELSPESVGCTLFIKRKDDAGKYNLGVEKFMTVSGEHLFEEVSRLTSQGNCEVIALDPNKVPILHFSYGGLKDPFFKID